MAFVPFEKMEAIHSEDILKFLFSFFRRSTTFIYSLEMTDRIVDGIDQFLDFGFTRQESRRLKSFYELKKYCKIFLEDFLRLFKKMN